MKRIKLSSRGRPGKTKTEFSGYERASDDSGHIAYSVLGLDNVGDNTGKPTSLCCYNRATRKCWSTLLA